MCTNISAKDTAALIRAALKKEFTGVKFSVRTNTYAGGGSIDVAWTDGPARATVEAVTDPFAGKGLIDHTDYAPHLTGQLNGEPVHYMADHVFTHRKISEDTKDALATELAAALQVQTLEPGKAYSTPDLIRNARPDYRYEQGSAHELIQALAEARAT